MYTTKQHCSMQQQYAAKNKLKEWNVFNININSNSNNNKKEIVIIMWQIYSAASESDYYHTPHIFSVNVKFIQLHYISIFCCLQFLLLLLLLFSTRVILLLFSIRSRIWPNNINLNRWNKYTHTQTLTCAQ